MNFKEEKIEEHFKHLAAEFLQKESNRTSLVTVTGAHISDTLAKATIYFTVFPDSKQKTVLDFVRRKRTEFRQYVRENSKTRRIPTFDFEIDLGEKNRQRIDQISSTM